MLNLKNISQQAIRLSAILVVLSCGKKADFNSKPNSEIYGIWDVTNRWTPSEVEAEKEKETKRNLLMANGPTAIPKELVAKTPEPGIRQIQINKDSIHIILQVDENDPSTITDEYECKIIHWQDTVFQADCSGDPDPDTVFTFYKDKETKAPVLMIRKLKEDALNIHLSLRKLSDI